MVPLVRSAISVPAGVERMPLLLFAALTAAGSLIWNTAFVLAGYALGENWNVVEQYMGIVSRVVLVVLALAVVGFIAHRIWRRRHPKEPSPDSPTEVLPVVHAGSMAESPTVRLPAARPAPPPVPPRRPSRVPPPRGQRW
jgi:hypothetical protein